MRFLFAIVTALAVGSAAEAAPTPKLSAALVRVGYYLRLDRASDGHGSSLYALQNKTASTTGCDVRGDAIENYLFVDQKSGEQRWLFEENQSCIWRTLHFAGKDGRERAVVYDITPSGAWYDWGKDGGMEGFRICAGTNPCLPLRRILMSKPDGRKLMALTKTFQITNPVDEARVEQRGGTIVVSEVYRRGEAVVFDLDTFELILSGGSHSPPPH